MPFESGVVDANILIYAADKDAPQFMAARALLRAARNELSFSVTSQILCEFYSVVTNGRRVRRPLSSGDAQRAISTLLAFLNVLPTTAQSVDILKDLLRRHPVSGGKIFDLQIAATMMANDVYRIYTFNTADFQPFSELEVLAP